MTNIIPLFKPKKSTGFYSPRTQTQQISSLVKNLAEGTITLENDNSYLRNSTCYLCNEQISDTAWQLTLRTDFSIESFYLDGLCCDSLLFAAGIKTNTNPSCPLNQDQTKIKKASYKPIKLSQYNYNYSKTI
jgi:hypothetical protein